MEIKFISTGSNEYEAMKALRLKVLLEPIGVPASYINPEKERFDLLIGAFENDELIGCCILTPLDKTTVQLRQMAVNTTQQGSGVGRAIVSFAEDVLRIRGYQTLFMHARDAVLDFYRKCGYAVSSEPFFEVGIAHHKMEKQLKP